mgnify:CR=1 FL=1
MRGGGGSLPQPAARTAPSSEGAERNAKEGKINMIGNNSRYTAEYRRRALYVRAFDRMVEKRKTDGLPTEWKNGEEVMRWWLNDNPKEG